MLVLSVDLFCKTFRSSVVACVRGGLNNHSVYQAVFLLITTPSPPDNELMCFKSPWKAEWTGIQFY